MPLIILEGPDGAGKTTLVASLVKDYRGEGVPVVTNHGSYLGEPDIAWRYADAIEDARAHPRRLSIMDRSWIAEPIYGAVMRGGASRIGDDKRVALERSALTCDGAAVILCLPPFEACRVAWASRLEREYPQKEGQLSKVWDGYYMWMALLPTNCELPVVAYDRTTETYGGLLARLGRAIGGTVPL